MSATLERGLAALRAGMDTPMATFFASCVHCGLCAEACLFYTETGDPKYTPIHKLEPLRRLWKQEFTLLGKLMVNIGLDQPVSDAELAEWEPLVYDSCTLCGRCSLACPAGNDITAMIRKMREGMALSGHAPEDLVHATQRAVTLGSPMGVKLSTLKAKIRAQERESGLTIPLDQPGVDYMVLFSGMEIVQFSEILGAMARIFKHAGVSWTLSSEAFEATNSGIQLGVSDLAKEILLRTVNAAEKLGVKGVVSPECGHAYTALRWEGPNLIGRRYHFEVVHILELLARLQKEKRLRLRQRDPEERPLSFHDPCQLARRGGVLEEPRELLGKIATDFREMSDNRERNWCCGGGGGVSAIERSEPLRAKAFQRKLHQIEELGVHTLVTACSNCRIILEEGLETYQIRVDVAGLTELVADHLEEDQPQTGAGAAGGES
ncbi:MAG: (Fe-S)-binding protein [Magnetococcales bacterium]|nr:(Fe-S)-binding protein [Magnetococcales bacterium]